MNHSAEIVEYLLAHGIDPQQVSDEFPIFGLSMPVPPADEGSDTPAFDSFRADEAGNNSTAASPDSEHAASPDSEHSEAAATYASSEA